MKSTENFKLAMLEHISSMCTQDKEFERKCNNPNKNIDDCVTYILNTVKTSEIQGFTDAEIYSMAVHYYSEEKIDVGSPMECQVIVNHTVELTEEEKAQAKRGAIDKAQKDALAKMAKKPVSTKSNLVLQGSLF